MSAAALVSATKDHDGSAIPTTPVWRLTLDQYHAMIDGGILKTGDPVEFLEGVLVPKVTRNPRHRIALAHLRDLLQVIIGPGWHLESQEAITLEVSEPEPDLAIVRGRVDDYPDRHPGPGDIALVVEVSDSTLLTDRGLKKRINARAAIREYWIVNLLDRQIEVYSDPTGPDVVPDYRGKQVFSPGQVIPVTVESLNVGMIAVADVLP